MWTTWVRERAVSSLPPEKLLPDRQPSYVSSWIYVFGVATIAALVVVVASGMILGLGGPTWWHTTSLGRFLNGIHLWGVELFFFAMVVHLWGKFFMGAWRGGRGRTWVTGAITFLVAIGAAFTGYLSQQNFDSQWIASEGKDGLNSVGIGAFFNVANFGQMYTFHVILLPLAVTALVVWHVLLVRRHGVVPPYPAKVAAAAETGDAERGSDAVSATAPAAPDPRAPWPGPFVRYDLIKELVVALGVVTLLAIVLTVLFSSPDDPPTTIQSWAQADPGDFIATATTELAGTSELAEYGPPYNHTPEATQKIGPLDLQSTPGVRIPIDTAKDFVLEPLSEIPANPRLKRALAAYQAAPPALQEAWTGAYEEALPKARIVRGIPVLPAGRYGPVAPMMVALLGLAQSGGLDGALLAGDHRFYQTNYTKPLLFLSGGGYFEERAEGQHLLGTQWGMMNETGSYPGQVWLWLYTFWYQVEPFKESPNADALIFALMGVLSLAFICIPFIPGLRTLPRHLRLYRVIWRDHYREAES